MRRAELHRHSQANGSHTKAASATAVAHAVIAASGSEKRAGPARIARTRRPAAFVASATSTD
jgi:hypothetical protein